MLYILWAPSQYRSCFHSTPMSSDVQVSVASNPEAIIFSHTSLRQSYSEAVD